jgi:ALG11 mannosyltransferase N-terminus
MVLSVVQPRSLLTFLKVTFQVSLTILCIIIIFHRGCSFMHRQIRRRRQPPPPSTKPTKQDVVIAFFHPYCTGGGGGERVLWKMIQVLSQLISNQKHSHNNSDDHDDDHDTRKKYHTPNYNRRAAATGISFHPTMTYVEGMFQCTKMIG